MGGDSTYYFAPPADPLNPLHHRRRQSWLDAFGRANAARFDERGFAYFIREVYDSFYPGYGESWPIFHGAIGMTYEQASARGLAFRARGRHDADVSRGRRAPLHRRHHDRAPPPRAIASACCATSSSTAAARSPRARRGRTREYLLLPGNDPSRADAAGAAAGGAGHRGAARGRGVQSPARGSCRRARTSSRRRSRRAGWCATCSTRTSRSPRRS